MAAHIAVKNFERFQHYKDRSPPWIKLYNDLLDDYAFACLPDASKWLAVGLWLLASRSGNRIPNDPKWIGSMVHASETVNLEPLITAGFITVCDETSNVLAEREQPAMPEREREVEEDTDSPSLSFEERERVVDGIIQAANRGMIGNPRIDREADPIVMGHGSRQDVHDWLAAGIPPEWIAETVETKARSYIPDRPGKPIASMRYFDGAVTKGWQTKLAREKANAEPSGGAGATGGSPAQARRAAAGGSGPRKEFVIEE